MMQTATIEIIIPNGNKWNVADVVTALKKQGIKAEVKAVFNHLKIPKDLLKPILRNRSHN